ncbi:MAG: hypothetical protein V1822_01765, partial [Candidatus Micrarchaeota archaeon]
MLMRSTPLPIPRDEWKKIQKEYSEKNPDDFARVRIERWKRLERIYGEKLTGLTRRQVDIGDYYSYKAAFAENDEEAKKTLDVREDRLDEGVGPIPVDLGNELM